MPRGDRSGSGSGSDAEAARLGRQQIIWDSADKFHPISNLNALDVEDPTLFGATLANQMIAIDYRPSVTVGPEDSPTLAELSLQVVWVPFFKPARLPQSAGLGFTAHDAFSHRANTPLLKRLITQEDALIAAGWTFTNDPKVVLPEETLDNSMVGARMAWTLLGIDMGFSYFYDFDDFPRAEKMATQIDVTDVTGTISLTYPRVQVLGFDAATSLDWLDGMGLWTEIGVALHDDLDRVVSTGPTIGSNEIELAPARVVALHLAGVELLEELGDASVERLQREERLVAQTRQNPALDDLHADFDLGFVARFGGPRRQDRRLVVMRQLFVGALDPGLVAAGDRDARLELVRHNRARHAAEVPERPHVARDEVGPALRQRRLGVRVVGRAQDGDEELGLDDLAGRRVGEVRLLAGVVDEDLLAGPMHLPHREAAPREPLPILLAELRVTIPVGVPLEILVVQELERHAGTLAFSMQVSAVRPRPGLRALPQRVDAGLELVVVQRRDGAPVKPGRGRALYRPAYRAERHGDARSHLSMAPLEPPFLPKNLSYVSHGQSFR